MANSTGRNLREPWPGYGYYVGQLVMSSAPARRGCIVAVDPVEALDACHEDAEGRLPHEPGYGGVR
jgi:hypothetical protein